MRTPVAVGVIVAVVTVSAAVAKEPAALEPLAFLIGEWPASGAGPSASGAAVFARGLQDRVIVRTSYAESRSAAGESRPRHDDLMVIYATAEGGARADYYDNEGHVIRYVVRSPAPGRAVFLSEAAPGEARFRLSYTLEDGVLRGEFAIAPAEAPEAFKPYLSWESRKSR